MAMTPRGADWRAARLTAQARERIGRRLAFPVLAGLVVAIGLLAPLIGPVYFAPVLVVVPMLVGGLLLRRRQMAWVIALTVVSICYDIALIGWHEVRPGALPVLLVAALMTYESARRREELGVPALRGTGMLVELRDRLQMQGALPELPPGWRVEVALESAGHAGFAGDFLVSRLRADHTLELALVDVSGKGVDAGTRSLMLSGALGGLLGAVPPEQFLAAANEYLLRQQWTDGFATAVHVAVDLDSGDYLLESAGHPPAAHFLAGSGRWHIADASGMAIGMFPDASWQSQRGRLRPGDAMLMYTDGVVEVPGRDLGLGIDRLLGAANELVIRSFDGSAKTLINSVARDTKDDKAVLVLWRT
jgi:hypothetical protein